MLSRTITTTMARFDWKLEIVTEILLLVALGVNVYFVLLLMDVGWHAMHGLRGFQAAFDLGLDIVAISVPMAVFCLAGVAAWFMLRHRVERVRKLVVTREVVWMSLFNITAPGLLALGLFWVLR
jgi:hypothetical protein